jgi:hypothetical protein
MLEKEKMDSRIFIKQASELTRRIADMRLALLTGITPEQDSTQSIQKDLSQTFASLQNPTLPSAYKLRDAALNAGYQVDPKVLHRIQIGESLWN